MVTGEHVHIQKMIMNAREVLSTTTRAEELGDDEKRGSVETDDMVRVVWSYGTYADMIRER